MQTVNLKCNINSLGIGIWGTMFADALSKLCDLRLDTSLNYAPEGLDELGLANRIDELHNKPTDPNVPTISLGQAHPAYIANYGSPRIIYPIFETTQLASYELQLINQADRVWVPSNWAKEVLLANKVSKQIDVVPLGVDTEFYSPQKRGQNLISQSLSTFRDQGYKVFFSGGKFEKRKGHYLILNSLDKLLSGEKICLLARWDNPFIKDFPAFFKQMLASFGFTKEGSHYRNGSVIIYGLPRKPSFSYVRSLYAEADFGLFPAFAEGWNLPLIEMLSMGIPCITTNYSAHTEFVDPDNQLSITAENGNMVPANDGVWFHGDRGDWFEPTMTSIAEKIQIALNMNNNTYKYLASPMRGNAHKFTWDHAAKVAIKLLEEV